MDEETQKDTRQMMEMKDNAPCNNQPIRAKDQAPKKKWVRKREDPKKKTLSRNRSPSPSNAGRLQPLLLPLCNNLINVGAVRALNSCGSCVLWEVLLNNLINVGAVHALNSCGSCVGWEVG